MAQYDGLLQQISEYEQEALERRNRLRELRDSVVTAHGIRKTTEANVANLQKELKIKTNELIETELTSKLLTSKENIYQQRKAEIEDKVNELDKEKADVSKSLTEEKESFCETIKQLTAKWGINSSYRKTREQQFSGELLELEELKQRLQSELSEMNKTMDVINRLRTEREEVNRQQDNVDHTTREISSAWCTEALKTDDLNKEYISVSDIYSHPEFIRNQAELSEESQISHKLEEEHSTLQAKFHTLHQKIWRQKKQRNN